MARDRLIEALALELPGAVQESGGRAALLPRSEGELVDALRIATRLGAPMCAPGSAARDGAVTIDLRRMADLLAFDDDSQLVHAEAGALVADIEAALEHRGLTLGMAEAPGEPVGAWIAEGAVGSRDKSADPVDQIVAGLSAVLADGRLLHVRPAPRRAVGPDLVSAFVGGRGRLGVITSLHLVARQRSTADVVSFRFDAPDTAASALAWMRGRGVRVLAAEIQIGDGAQLSIRIDGPERLRRVRAAVARRIAEEKGGRLVDEGAAPLGARGVEDSRTAKDLASALDIARVLS